MTEHDPHDDHLATAVAATWTASPTTATVNDRVTAIITDFETFRTRTRTHLRNLAIITGFALGTALAAVVLEGILR